MNPNTKLMKRLPDTKPPPTIANKFASSSWGGGGELQLAKDKKKEVKLGKINKTTWKFFQFFTKIILIFHGFPINPAEIKNFQRENRLDNGTTPIYSNVNGNPTNTNVKNSNNNKANGKKEQQKRKNTTLKIAKQRKSFSLY